ncbi:hypothetical protein PIB30_077041, partial [Stylosanthes scabra]|nr:hypothetical protein [Stylosanthes scabra]
DVASEELLTTDTIWYAILVPNPVLMNPFAKKKASATNHGIWSPKAENAPAYVSVFVSTVAQDP